MPRPDDVLRAPARPNPPPSQSHPVAPPMPTKKPTPMLIQTAPDWSWYEFRIKDQVIRVTKQEALEAELSPELDGAAPVTRARYVAAGRVERQAVSGEGAR